MSLIDGPGARAAASPAPTRGLLAAAALVGAVLALAGQMRPWISPDTPGWLNPCEAAGCWAGPRTPVYAWLTHAVTADGTLPQAILPWLQYAALVAAAWWLMRGMARLGASAPAALAVGLAIVGSNLAVLWARALLPELFAHAAMLAAIAATLHAARGRSDRATAPQLGLALVAGGLSGVAYLLKPGLILLAPMLPVLLALVAPSRRGRGVVVPAAVLLGAGVVPFALVASWRWAMVGDFNIVSFGGFQMSGMAALMLTPDIVHRLPPAIQGPATEIIARRDALVAAHLALPIPLNSVGQRSFVSAAAGYFDVLARTHDNVLYGAVAGGRSPGESWVAFNGRMQQLAVATISAAPVDYAAWVLGAATRMVGRALVVNLPFMLGCLSWACACLSRRAPAAAPPGDLRLLGLLTALWSVGAGAPSVLLTFPAARYIDSACLMLAAWPIHATLRRIGAARGQPAN